MILSILYVLLAILGLSFLVFIHELGHYFMARRLGMRVEVFSIGFGKPMYAWERDGVKWQIGWLPFGGYVKITGMETNDQQNPYEIKDGFYGKSPWDRIKVAFMGPFVNILFTLIAFTALWMIGGRDKNFSEYTHKIGWLDQNSDLYAKGVRPGDEISSYNGQPFQSSKDHLYAPMTAHGNVEVKGYQVNPYTKERKPFSHPIKPYPHPGSLEKEIMTTGILQSANYVIYDRFNGQDNPLPEGSPMQESGIQYGDRIVWVDGEIVYSMQQLSHILNDSRAFFTIQRGRDTIFRRVARVQAEELKLDSEVKEELIDWQFEARLNGTKIQKLYTIPYNLNNEGVVENVVKFIDKDKEEEAFSAHPFSSLEAPLEVGDKIIAVDGIPVQYSFEILANLQIRHVNIVVERSELLAKHPIVEQADVIFDQQIKPMDLQKIVSQIGFPPVEIRSSGNLVLLNTVVPKMRNQFTLSPEGQAQFTTESERQKKEIEGIEDPEKRAQALQKLESRDRQLLLGLPMIADQKIHYNPNPLELFTVVFEEIWNTLGALFSGSLNPKWMSGPIGIVQVVHDNSMVSLKEALFWLGAISLNLGVLNLLPLPVLDGGNICFALYELMTGQRLKSKTMEKVIIPFAILLIGFFIFLTYNDLSRLLSGFFH